MKNQKTLIMASLVLFVGYMIYEASKKAKSKSIVSGEPEIVSVKHTASNMPVPKRVDITSIPSVNKILRNKNPRILKSEVLSDSFKMPL